MTDLAERLRAIRVQLSRKKGWRMPANTVSVARPTKWGNPFKVGMDGTAVQCVEHFQDNMPSQWKLKVAYFLRGKNLACWCALDKPCHADVLLAIANGSLDD